MRFPLALKVSIWLLLNLALLGVLAAGFLVSQGGFNWSALVEGPPGRRLQVLADATAGDLRGLPPARRNEILAEFAESRGVTAAIIGASGQILTGTLADIPAEITGMIRPRPNQTGPAVRPRPLAQPDPNREGPPDVAPEDGPPNAGPPGEDRQAHQVRRQRLLIREGDPAVYWLAARIDRPDRSPALMVLRVPSFGVLLKLLDLAPWLWTGAAAVGVSLLFWLPFVRGLTRDLGRLNRATEAIADGRFETRVAENRRDEVGALGGSVNRMAGRLDRLVTGQKRFLGDIAHELGSPLGRMQVSVSILEQRADPALHNAINDVREEVEHMSALVGELLAFTQAGLRPRDAALTQVTLAPLVARVLAREAADDAVTVQLPESLAVRADADLLARAIGNLVRNALRHAGRNSQITLRAETERGVSMPASTVRNTTTSAGSATCVALIVEDEGPGVPPEALARLGEPLYRPEAARTRETGGAGLGLAIVKSCVEACGGSVHFENRTPKGFRVTLRLPAAE